MDEGKHDDREWTGRFLRLRLEVFGVALIIFLYAVLQGSLKATPILNLDHGLREPVLVFALSLLWAYLAVHFWVRYNLEKRNVAGYDRNLLSLNGELLQQCQKAEEIAERLDPDSVQARLSQLPRLEAMNAPLTEAVNRLQQSSGLFEALSEEFRTTVFPAVRRSDANIGIDGVMTRLEDGLKHARGLHDQVNGATQELANRISEWRSLADEIQNSYGESIGRANAMVDELRATQARMRNLARQFRTARLGLWSERTVLTVWIPFIVSSAMVAASYKVIIEGGCLTITGTWRRPASDLLLYDWYLLPVQVARLAL